MASLKEVKGRIASVNNTRKITSAMKMVASAKLHKAQAAIENMLPYERRLNHILTNFLSADSEVESPFIVKREVKRVAIVVFASNTSLCGGFNANIIRHLTVILDEYKFLGMENVLLYPVGRKVAEGVKKLGFKAEGDFQHMADKPSYQEAAALAEDLMRRFLHRDIDKVELLYNHFRSTAVQVLTRETYLPIDLTQEKKEEDKGRIPDYIVEPSVDVVMGELLPKVLRMKMFTVLLDSNASEHAARTMAMQIATRPDAQHTNSQQTNRNLCATRDARMYTQPQLEIYADDVKCSHGATVGQLDEGALFYMRSRGIAEKEARLLLMFAFVNEVIDTIRLEALKDRLHLLVEKRFRGELNRCQGCAICK